MRQRQAAVRQARWAHDALLHGGADSTCSKGRVVGMTAEGRAL